MPAKQAKKIVGFRYVGTSPVSIIGLGDLQPGDIVSIDKAKEVFGEDFNGSLMLVPVEEEQQDGGEK